MLQATDQGVIDGVMYQGAIEGAIKDASDGSGSHRRIHGCRERQMSRLQAPSWPWDTPFATSPTPSDLFSSLSSALLLLVSLLLLMPRAIMIDILLRSIDSNWLILILWLNYQLSCK